MRANGVLPLSYVKTRQILVVMNVREVQIKVFHLSCDHVIKRLYDSLSKISGP